MNEMDEIDPGLDDELKQVAAEAGGYAKGGARDRLEARISVTHARAIYAAAESQARSSKRLEKSTERLAAFTRGLMFATIALALATAVLVLVTAFR